MASMPTTLPSKTTFPSRSLSNTFHTQFAPSDKLKLSVASKQKPFPRLTVSNALIEPDGGKLVNLIVEESQRNSRRMEALSLPRIQLSKIDVEWVHVLSGGWASPLRGFMRETEFLQTLHFNSLRLHDGSIVNMSVPIVLAIDDEQKHLIGESRNVALFDSQGNPVAILKE